MTMLRTLNCTADFAGSVTVLDLIANCGRESSRHIVSMTPDLPVEL